MPVAELLIEGVEPRQNQAAHGLDARLLNKLLAGVCAVRPRGSKYFMEQRIGDARAAGAQGTYGLLDGDFQYPWPGVSLEPLPWMRNGQLLGWRWSRKELENYLLDPEVVTRALRLDPSTRQRYEAALGEAYMTIGPYQAARMALSSVRPRPNTLDNRQPLGAGARQGQLPLSRCCRADRGLLPEPDPGAP